MMPPESLLPDIAIDTSIEGWQQAAAENAQEASSIASDEPEEEEICGAEAAAEADAPSPPQASNSNKARPTYFRCNFSLSCKQLNCESELLAQ